MKTKDETERSESQWEFLYGIPSHRGGLKHQLRQHAMFQHPEGGIKWDR